MFGVLDRYIGRTILYTILTTLFVLTSLSSIIKFIEQLRKVGQGEYSVINAGIYTLLGISKDIEIFFPMAVLLGALLGLGNLVLCNELVAIQALGFTRIQIAVAVMKTTIPLILLMMAIGEWIAPQGDQIARSYRTEKIFGNTLLTTQSSLWIKDGTDFIHINQVLNNNTLSGVNIYHFDQQDHLLSVRYAAMAIFQDNLWQLFQVNESDLRDTKQISESQTLTGQWETNIVPDKLDIIKMDLNSLSISKLYYYIKYLKQNQQESNRYQLNMWSKIFSPILVTVMMLLALSFIFGPLRDTPMGGKIIIGIFVGFIFYIINQIIGSLSLVYKISPIISALFPSIFFLFVSLYFLLRHSR
ncbi:LPS export ABC transporter permease LptG [Candidatus Fukatsuia anoeciicola]|uniref:LPS export ABC transporter permease LptG n=1 Tax=Candidatus Fukatsuia anoeciicola TaxID=2994492 RepID=UPI0034645F41